MITKRPEVFLMFYLPLIAGLAHPRAQRANERTNK